MVKGKAKRRRVTHWELASSASHRHLESSAPLWAERRSAFMLGWFIGWRAAKREKRR